MPYGITQYYLPPGGGDIPAVAPAEAGTRLSDPGGMQGMSFRLLPRVLPTGLKFNFTEAPVSY